MDGVERFAQRLGLILDAVISFFFSVIVVVTILQVALRYLFNESILGGNELMEGLFIYTTALGAAAAVRRRQHISIAYFAEKLPPSLRRVDDILVHLLVAGLNGIMIFYSVRWIGMVGSNESPVMRVPEWTFQISVPVGCSLVILYCLVTIAAAVRGRSGAEGDGSC